MTRTALRLTVGLMVLGTFLAGCGGTSEEQQAIEGKTWVLEEYRVAGSLRETTPGVRSDALFEAGRVAGNAGVNTYSAAYTLDGPEIAISAAASTRMAGSPEAMAQEQAFLASLDRANRQKVVGDTLELLAGEEVLLRLVEEAPVTLTDGTWLVLGYLQGTGFKSPLAGSAITLRFADDGRLSGVAGVNRYAGTYTATERSLTAETALQTQNEVSEEVGHQEAAYLEALNSATTYELSGRELQLFNEQGTRAVQARLP